MVFPFNEKSICSLYYGFIEHKVDNITVLLTGNKRRYTVTFTSFPIIENDNAPLWNRLWDKVCEFKLPMKHFDLLVASNEATIDDFSWWSLPHNIGLYHLLALKAIRVSNYDSYEIYSYESPGIQGFVTVGATSQYTDETKYVVGADFTDGKEAYAVTFISVPESEIVYVKRLLSTIEPFDVAGELNGSELNYPQKLGCCLACHWKVFQLKGLSGFLN